MFLILLPQISFRVTEHLKSLIAQKARSGNQSVSNYLRAVVLGANQIGTPLELEEVRQSLRRLVELAHALRLSCGDNATHRYRDREGSGEIHSDWEAFFQAIYELEASLLNLEEQPNNGTRTIVQE